MARIKRRGARLYLANNNPEASMRSTGSEGLKFCFSIKDDGVNKHSYEVELSEYELEKLNEAWDRMRKDFET